MKKDTLVKAQLWITKSQKDLIVKHAKRLKISQSDFMRQIISSNVK